MPSCSGWHCCGAFGIMQIMTSSTIETGANTNQVLQKAAVAADGSLSILASKVFQDVGDNSFRNPIAFSGDGLNVFMAIPSLSVSVPPRRETARHHHKPSEALKQYVEFVEVCFFDIAVTQSSNGRSSELLVGDGLSSPLLPLTPDAIGFVLVRCRPFPPSVPRLPGASMPLVGLFSKSKFSVHLALSSACHE